MLYHYATRIPLNSQLRVTPTHPVDGCGILALSWMFKIVSVTIMESHSLLDIELF